jgi:parallel beta-helix repeat protein
MNGIDVESPSNSSIVGNSVTNNYNYGIMLDYFCGSTVVGNNITNNRYGIWLSWYSKNNSVVGNHITSNYYGIYLWVSSDNNSIVGNNITNNEYGVYLGWSSDNKFHHNNFIDNTLQVHIETPARNTNFWNDGWEGNYWNDYGGDSFDKYGIGYDPYVIDENNTDYYPLMNPYILGDVNHDAHVNIVDITIIATAFGSQLGDTKWDPHADIDGNGKINIVDISMAAKEFGKEWKEETGS